ncbi:transmembrane amino acid transporter protein [Gigaspora rosea]|uniref:Transmembrane amino acid transporter protein n=1 Tax=Gigaspora rosea TaxID=44941 RepID=A0A397VSD5_9GLOM|nr:transmembrane amino acid transporter protein [Gigaspora rosea]
MNAGEETSAFCDNPQNYNEEIRETSHLCNNSQKNYNAISKDTVINNDLEKNSTSGNGSDWAAYMNIVCVVAGSGALGIPYALQQGGWISLMFLILAALMSTYTSIKLIECLDHGKTRKTSISELAYYAFGNIGLCVVGFFFNVISLGCPILYLVLSGDNLQTLFSNYGIDLGMQTWVYICAGTMCIPFIFLKSMKETAWLSIFGVATTLFVVLIVFIISIIEYPNNSKNHHDFISFRNLPIALSTFFFSFGGNVVYPHIQASMKNKKAWPKVITLAKLTITFMYLLIGIPAYLTYGRNTQSPIYLSLPPGLIVDITTIMITMHILLALPVYQTAFSLELENFLFTNISITLNNTSEFISRTIIRLILVIFTVYVAVTVPYFTNIMALLGALGNGVLIMVTPMLIWIKLFGWDHFKDFKEKIWAIFILIFSLTGAIIGTWDALDALSTQIMGGN